MFVYIFYFTSARVFRKFNNNIAIMVKEMAREMRWEEELYIAAATKGSMIRECIYEDIGEKPEAKGKRWWVSRWRVSCLDGSLPE